jgi:hypothetical protein
MTQAHARLTRARTKELTNHTHNRLNHGMALDEDNAYNMVLVARDQDCVIAYQDSNRRFRRNLPQLHGFMDNRMPALIAYPLRVTGATRFRMPVEDRHNAVVAQNAFNSSVCHGVS